MLERTPEPLRGEYTRWLTWGLMNRLTPTVALAAVLILVGAVMIVAGILRGVVLVVGGGVIIAKDWIS